jgi:PTS system ascorbate-specific IIA component
VGEFVSATLFGVEVPDWREVIRTVCGPLLEAGAIEAGYIGRCIDMVEEHGPYMVVAPGIALAHARPEDGVNTLCLSVATLSHPVLFHHQDNDPVDLVFAFGSPDDKQHVELLSTLARALSNGLDKRLRAAESEETAQQIMEDVLNDVT